jgi:type II secretory pathway pseudopilin PulG
MSGIGYKKAREPTLQRVLQTVNYLRGERGIGLAESLVAIAIIGITVVTFITALSTGVLAVREFGQEAVAQQLARTQLEYLKSYSYDETGLSYPLVDTPPGYTISLETDSSIYADSDIQEITVTVYKDSEPTLTVAAYKVKR